MNAASPLKFSSTIEAMFKIAPFEPECQTLVTLLVSVGFESLFCLSPPSPRASSPSNA